MNALYINQDRSCLAVCLPRGVRVFRLEPVLEEVSTNGLGCPGTAAISLLDKSNYLALVGGRDANFPASKVFIWDASVNRAVVELEFRRHVMQAVLTRRHIIVILSERIHVFTFDSASKCLASFDTCGNERGLVSLSVSAGLLAFSGRCRGSVNIVDISKDCPVPHTCPVITAHESSLSCISLNDSGSLIATASVKGTLIRIFDCCTGQLKQEFRRGSDYADIFSIAFNHESTKLVVGSDKGTVHIFTICDPAAQLCAETASSVGVSTAKSNLSNKQFNLPLMKDVLPKYFASEWSSACIRLQIDAIFLCFFGPDGQSVIIVSADGFYHKYLLDKHERGKFTRKEYCKYLK